MSAPASTVPICQHPGCGNPARWAPKLCVPPAITQVGRRVVTPATITTSLMLCDRCFDLYGVAVLLSDRARDAIEAAEAGKPDRPDFDRAFRMRVSIHSPEFVNLYGRQDHKSRA